MASRIKASRLLFAVILFFFVIITILMLSSHDTSSNVTTASATDNQQTQHFTAMLHDRAVTSTKEGYPIYDVIFIKQDGTVFDYYGGDTWTDNVYTHTHDNAIDIYTKGQTDANYAIDMDNSGNIVLIKGVGF
jgi:hypothetical protein